ncbi:MAG: LPS assembly protein LptD [Akkermansiaceae bacterium]|nr:LPS assembly protein LptD [Akkermansiaceae bacterium]
MFAMSKLAPWTLPALLFGAALLAQESDPAAVPGPNEVEPLVAATEAAEAVPGPDAVERIGGVEAPRIRRGADAADGFDLPEYLKIDNEGGKIFGDPKTHVTFEGPVKISGDNGLEAFADRAVLDFQDKTVTLSGDVSIYQGDVLQRGKRAVYHYEQNRMETDGMRASYDPILLEAGKFTWERRGERDVLVGRDAGITTHDHENPAYWVRSTETRIYPEEKIIFENLKFYVGETPVFWFPYLAQPLDSELGYHFLPGAKTAWGPYLLNTYGIMLGGSGEDDIALGQYEEPWLLSRWHFDIRGRRGLGAGVDLADIHSDRNDEITGLSLYYAHDLDPEFSRSGQTRTFSSPDRYKALLRHREHLEHLEPNADWRLDANLNYYSDEHYLEDFEEDIYRTNPAPDNTLGLYRRTDGSLLSFLGRYQLNDFYRADSRLPEVAFDLSRKPFLDSPILHQGTFSVGYYGERASDITKSSIIDPLSRMTLGMSGTAALLGELTGYERQLAEQMVSLPLSDPRREDLRQQLVHSDYGRLHTYQQFSAPMMVGEVLSLTPRAGLGYTRYLDVDDPGDDFGRPILHLGLEASMKFSREINDYRNHDLGIDRLLHVFQPYVNWSYIDTDDYSIGDPAVDRLTETTRPRPLDPSRYTAIDEMKSWNVVRMGMRNRLITHRDDQSFDWLFMDTYIDAFAENPEGDESWSNLYNDLHWRPLPWMRANLETQFPITEGAGFTELATSTTFMPSELFNFSLGYRWLNGHPFLPDSSRITLSTYTRLNLNWGIGTRHDYELDDGVLEYQQYTLNRDLGQWVAGLGFTARDNRLRDEYGVVLLLTLKDLPQVSLPFEFAGE